MTWDGSTTDAELLADEDVAGAFGVLFDRHAHAVYNHCFRLTSGATMPGACGGTAPRSFGFRFRPCSRILPMTLPLGSMTRP
jgi:hypothetical protein